MLHIRILIICLLLSSPERDLYFLQELPSQFPEFLSEGLLLVH